MAHLQTKNAQKKALQSIQESIPFPDICKDLNSDQKAFAEQYLVTASVPKSCKIVGYHQQTGYKLLNDVRIQTYLSYLRDIYDAFSAISKGQMVEKLGERFLSNDISDKDLASISRELRALQNYGSNIDINTQINIQLPETYKQFFEEEQAIKNQDDTDNDNETKEIDTGDWD